MFKVTEGTVFRICHMVQTWQSGKPKGSSIDIRNQHVLWQYQAQQALDQYFPEIHYTLNHEALMASNKNQFNLIEYKLSTEELEAYDAWVTREAPTVGQLLNYLASKDYKVSFSFSAQDATWFVSVTGKKDARFNSETTLTSRSDDWQDGLQMAVYKAQVIFDEGVWKTRIQAQRG